MNEIDVKINPIVGHIDYDFKEVKEALELQMSAYTSLVVTPENIKEAKADLAVLRKIRAATDDKRKEIKRAFMQPYEDMVSDINDLFEIIDKPIAMIDSKLKEYELERVLAKQEHIQELYDSKIGEYAEYLPLEKVQKTKWKNATCTDKEIIYDLSEAITKVRSELDIIKSLNSEIEDELYKVYKESGIAAAIQKNTDYIALKAKVTENSKEPEKPKGDFTFVIKGTENAAKVREYLDFAEIPYDEV